MPAIDDELIPSLFKFPEKEKHPGDIALRLLKLPEHAHLAEGEATIEFLLRVIPKQRGGRSILGTAYMPDVQGDLKDLFHWMLFRLFESSPDFLIVLDDIYWNECSDREREILVYHELLHCIHKPDKFGAPKFTNEGLPVWGLRGHDVEEFSATVARYGAWNEDLRNFINSVKSPT